MSVAHRQLPLGELVEKAFDDALSSWQRDNARGHDPEVFLTSEFMGASLTVSVAKNQPPYCYVEISARRPWHAGTYGYRLEAPGRKTPGGCARRVV